GGVGEMRVWEQDMERHGDRRVLEPNTVVVTLTGTEGEPANATWLGRKTQAARIDADRKRKTLLARGGVRASYLPPPAGAEEEKGPSSLPFFKAGETIYAMAGSLTFAD